MKRNPFEFEPNAKPNKAMVVGITWFESNEWARLLEISADREDLEETYVEWLFNAHQLLAKLESEGMTARKVPVNPETLLAWCNQQQRPVNSAARSAFVVQELQRQAKEAE